MEPYAEKKVYERFDARREVMNKHQQNYAQGKRIVNEAAAKVRDRFRIHSDGPIVECTEHAAINETINTLTPTERENAWAALRNYYESILVPILSCADLQWGEKAGSAADEADVARMLPEALEAWVLTLAYRDPGDL